MTNKLQDRFAQELAVELDRHATDAELLAHAAKRLVDKPVSQARLDEHLKQCLTCRARLALHDTGTTPEAERRVPAHWFQSGKVLLRSLPVEAGLLQDGRAFLHGARAVEVPLHLSKEAQAQQEWVVELPNNKSIDIQVHALEQTPLQYAVRIASSESPHIFVSLSQPKFAATREPRSTQLPEVDLNAERVLHRAELGYATKLRVGPGCWHLGFWSRTPGEPWSVVQLILHDEKSA